jgi:hypothetical protein
MLNFHRARAAKDAGRTRHSQSYEFEIRHTLLLFPKISKDPKLALLKSECLPKVLFNGLAKGAIAP